MVIDIEKDKDGLCDVYERLGFFEACGCFGAVVRQLPVFRKRAPKRPFALAREGGTPHLSHTEPDFLPT